MSFSKNPYYNVGFNSTNAGILSIMGNAALALGGEKPIKIFIVIMLLKKFRKWNYG